MSIASSHVEQRLLEIAKEQAAKAQLATINIVYTRRDLISAIKAETGLRVVPYVSTKIYPND